MEELITKEKTELPIGDTGLFINPYLRIDDYNVMKVDYIAGNLYKLKLEGMILASSDETGTVHKTDFDTVILDMDDKQIIAGYAVKMNEKLWVIFDTTSCFIGWPADDIITIKNIQTGKKISIEAQAPFVEEFHRAENLFIFKGCLWEGGTYSFVETKRWMVFINQEGKVIYKGFCWEYELKKNELIIKKFKKSRKKYSIFF